MALNRIHGQPLLQGEYPQYSLHRSESGTVGIRVAASSTECLSRHADGGGRGPARLAAYPRLRLQPSLPA